MNVTKENFKELLPGILDKLEKCKFISFDLEMSGIYSSDPTQRNRKDDLPSQRYQKMIGPATKYSIVQFGLSIFEEDSECGVKTLYYFTIIFDGFILFVNTIQELCGHHPTTFTYFLNLVLT